MDLMVSMAVVAILIALMMPSLSTVREAARKVVCSSNVRQIGLGVAMYADDHRGLLPYTKFADLAPGGQSNSQAMMILRTVDLTDAWDGLGYLYSVGYLDAAGVFYCPSHHGEHPFSRYAQQWSGADGEIFGNYQFRGSESITLDAFHGGQAMVADGMRMASDYNHFVGANVLRADMTVRWYSDSGRAVASLLPESAVDPNASQKINDAWDAIDNWTSSTR